MREINVLGIRLKDYSLKEELKLMDVYLKNGAMNTVIYLNTRLMVEAGADEELKKWIEEADLTVCGDEEVIRQMGIASYGRLYDAENMMFLSESLRGLNAKKASLFIIADNEQNLAELKKDIDMLCPEISISGEGIFGNDGNVNAQTINKINDLVPSMIILKMPFIFQKKLMNEGSLINSEVVIGIPEDMNISRREGFYEKIIRRVYRKVFIRKITEYKQKSDK